MILHFDKMTPRSLEVGRDVPDRANSKLELWSYLLLARFVLLGRLFSMTSQCARCIAEGCLDYPSNLPVVDGRNFCHCISLKILAVGMRVCIPHLMTSLATNPPEALIQVVTTRDKRFVLGDLMVPNCMCESQEVK